MFIFLLIIIIGILLTLLFVRSKNKVKNNFNNWSKEEIEDAIKNAKEADYYKIN